jgi:hypothetical protein
VGRLSRAVSVLRSSFARRLTVVCGALALTLGLSACGLGNKESRPQNVSQAIISAGDEPYFYAGPVTYQVQITRQLNPYATEDRQYLIGVPSSDLSLAPDQLWFGVFMWAKDQTTANVTTTDTFTITDSEGTTYDPVPVNPTLNPYAWTSQTLVPGGTEPGPDTTASEGPTQGGLVLFKLNDSVYSNRPLTLHIYAPGQAKSSSVSLDL